MVATVGQQGVNEVRPEHSGVILPDMSLPATEGWTEAGEIQKGPGTVSVPIVASTARHVWRPEKSTRRHQAIEALVAARGRP